MGIYDREYYRDDKGGSGWLYGAAPACKMIILINVGMFLLPRLFDVQELVHEWLANNSAAVLNGQVWRLITCAFLHNPYDIWHILINMLILWWVGRDMEAFYGTREFWWFYLSAAAVSSLCWVAMDHARHPADGHTAVGASGAVLAVMAVYTFYNPRREVILYFIPMEMWVLLTILVVSDGYSLWIHSNQPIGFAAHLGGVAYAFAFKQLDLRLKSFGGFKLKSLKRLIPGASPKLRLVYPPDPPPRERETPRPANNPPTPGSWSSPEKPNPMPRPSSVSVVSEESLDARFDEILAKIASQGRGSLTDEEKRICEEASRRARSKRSERIP